MATAKKAAGKMAPWTKEMAAEKKMSLSMLKKHEKKESPAKAKVEKKRGY